MWMWIKKYLKQVYFWGWRYRCVICDSQLRKWHWHGEDSDVHRTHQMVGSGRRETACPHCHSIDRERLIYLYLQNHCKKMEWSNMRVLHIAPENVLQEWIKQQRPLEYIRGDFFTEGYEYGQGTIHLDIQSLNFSADYFDLIICSHVLEHVEDDKKAILELWRVCKKGGALMVLVPMAIDLAQTIEGNHSDSPEYRKEHFGQLDHLRLYGTDFSQRLTNEGWEVRKWQPQPMLLEWKLNQDEFLFLGTKQK